MTRHIAKVGWCIHILPMVDVALGSIFGVMKRVLKKIVRKHFIVFARLPCTVVV